MPDGVVLCSSILLVCCRQDFSTRQEQGEARRKRAMEVFGDWCPQVGAGVGTAASKKAVRLARLAGYMRRVAAAGLPEQLRPGPSCRQAHVQKGFHSTAAAAAALSALPQVRSLIEGADAQAITEHGQFLRTPESCRVSARG